MKKYLILSIIYAMLICKINAILIDLASLKNPKNFQPKVFASCQEFLASIDELRFYSKVYFHNYNQYKILQLSNSTVNIYDSSLSYLVLGHSFKCINNEFSYTYFDKDNKEKIQIARLTFLKPTIDFITPKYLKHHDTIHVNSCDEFNEKIFSQYQQDETIEFKHFNSVYYMYASFGSFIKEYNRFDNVYYNPGIDQIWESGIDKIWEFQDCRDDRLIFMEVQHYPQYMILKLKDIEFYSKKVQAQSIPPRELEEKYKTTTFNDCDNFETFVNSSSNLIDDRIYFAYKNYFYYFYKPIRSNVSFLFVYRKNAWVLHFPEIYWYANCEKNFVLSDKIIFQPLLSLFHGDLIFTLKELNFFDKNKENHHSMVAEAAAKSMDADTSSSLGSKIKHSLRLDTKKDIDEGIEMQQLTKGAEASSSKIEESEDIFK